METPTTEHPSYTTMTDRIIRTDFMILSVMDEDPVHHGMNYLILSVTIWIAQDHKTMTDSL